MNKTYAWLAVSAQGLAAVLLPLLAGLSSIGCGRSDKATECRDSGLQSVSVPQVTPESLQSKLEGYLRAAEREWGFQGSVLVARGDKVILKKALGAADRANGIPNTPETRFLIASITKVFTATAVMKLAEEGLVRLEDSAVRYLPDFKDIVSGDIKISHLLSHSSGLPEFSPGAMGQAKTSEPVEPRTFVASLRGRKPLFSPGGEARYSNIGYILLGLVIENVTGESYYDWVGAHILKPLGMRDSGVSADYLSGPGFARGYVEDTRGDLRPAPYIHPTWGYSAGALFSTVEDLLKLDRALSSAGFLSAGSQEAMFRPQNPSFGYGWLVDSAFGRRTEAHGGGAPGYSAWIERWPEEGTFIAVLGNVTAAPAGEIGRSLAAAVFGEPYEMPVRRTAVSVTPDLLDEFIGSYKTKNGEVRYVAREGDAIFVSRGDGPRFLIVPYAEDSFFLPHDKAPFIRFVRDENGRVTGQVFHLLGVSETALKIVR